MDKKLITVIGGIVLVIGLFLPIVSGGGQSGGFLTGGIEWSGIVLLLCGVLAAILGLINQGKYAVFLGVAALGVVVFRFIQTKDMMGQAASMMPEGVELPPELASQLAAAMPSMNYLGWGVLGLGAVLILVGGALAWKSPSA
jgi:hypothetical protein